MAPKPDVPLPRSRIWSLGRHGALLLSALAVVVILAVLVGLAADVPFFTRWLAPKSNALLKMRTRVLLDDMEMACAQYYHDRGWVPGECHFGGEGTNDGAKALAAMLLPTYLNAEYLASGRYVKKDTDGRPMLVDAWGNPIVFIPRSCYGLSFMYSNKHGKAFAVTAPPQRFSRPFWLMSFGPNARYDGGQGDDVAVSLPKTSPADEQGP